MAHFARLDENNVVVQVIVVNNEDCLDENGVESEAVGVSFCQGLLGSDTRWKQTSYNHKFRRRYAGSGYLYFEPLDVFVEPQPYPSWTLDTATANWVAPVPKPSVPDIYILVWDEENQEWDAVISQGAV
jgi:hypothetical protein